MVCDGPDPPENNINDLILPPRHELMINNNDDSDDERHEHFGYEPLPQGPDATQSDHENSDTEDNDAPTPHDDVPPIETMDAVISREVWNAPRNSESIEMDNDRAEQVMLAMANFALPQASIPEWAQSITEEQWKQTLKDRIEKLREDR